MNKKRLLILLCILLAFQALFLLLKGIRLSFQETLEPAAAAVSGSPALSLPDTDSPEVNRTTRKEVNIFLNQSGNE